MAWYQVQPFPMYQPNEELVTTIANSTLCHVSVTKWCLASGENRSSPAKKNRCGGLSADVAGKTVQMIDKHLAGTFAREYKEADIVSDCNVCHGQEPVHVTGKEDCSNCHVEENYRVFPHK